VLLDIHTSSVYYIDYHHQPLTLFVTNLTCLLNHLLIMALLLYSMHVSLIVGCCWPLQQKKPSNGLMPELWQLNFCLIIHSILSVIASIMHDDALNRHTGYACLQVLYILYHTIARVNMQSVALIGNAMWLKCIRQRCIMLYSGIGTIPISWSARAFHAGTTVSSYCHY
jgi:hypothetical protein